MVRHRTQIQHTARAPGPGLMLLVALLACDAAPTRPKQAMAPPATAPLVVGVAASFRGVAQAVAEQHQAAHPGLSVRVIGGGSQALARRALELAEPFDVLLLADASLFAALLEPTWTASHEIVASDRLVLARAASGHAPDGAHVGRDDWPERLLRPGVRIGMADPDRAPLGYRTLLSWQLAERHYARQGLATALRERVGTRHVWPDAAALLAPLETGAIDYAFVYAASALAARLPFSELPAEVNLGDPNLAATYAGVSVQVAGDRPGSLRRQPGAPIVYAAALGHTPHPQAAAYLARLRSWEGQRVMAAHGFSQWGDSNGALQGSP